MSRYILQGVKYISLDKFYKVYYYFEAMSEKYMKASEIAKKYEVTSYAVKNWIKTGLLPNAKLEESIAGSVWLIPESDLENFTKPEMGRPKKMRSDKK